MKSLITTFMLLLSFTVQATAAEVALAHWRGNKVLSIRGQIQNGDAQKVEQLLPRADVLRYGARVVLLESLGGAVEEALRISLVFDHWPVHTVIAEGSKCASACGSIIFIAGMYRTMEDGAALGQHSCSLDGRPDEHCNEVIVSHAVNHGISRGAVEAALTYVSPDKILWYSRSQTEGWGLTKYPGEEMSGFVKNEPNVLKLFLGKYPEAQDKWRIGFRENTLDAFVRPVADFDRDMQIMLFCHEESRRVFLIMEVAGAEQDVRDAVLHASFATDVTERRGTSSPLFLAKEKYITEVIVEIPPEMVTPFLTRAKELQFGIQLREPYKPMIAWSLLADSREVLRFAVDGCIN